MDDCFRIFCDLYALRVYIHNFMQLYRLLIRLVSCVPVSYQWDPNVSFHCVNQIVLFRTALVTDVVTDGGLLNLLPIASYRAKTFVGLILLFPVSNVWKLQMRTPDKMAVIGIFFLGGFTTITGIIRLHFLTYTYASLKHPLFDDVSCM